MATYKVLQDIESEDKLFGPLTLKQFIFAALAIVIAFVSFRILAMPVPIFIKLPVIMVMFPFFVVFGFLAAPLGRDQPNDIWLLARLRFLFKPRRRIWSQEGVSQQVTITAPKKIEPVLVDTFSLNEVESRLSALANTLDSRGWAVKNVNTNMFSQPGYLTTDSSGSDRLVAPVELPQDVPVVDVLASDDILDPASNSTAQHLDQLVQQSTAAVKAKAASSLRTPAAAPQPTAQDYYFMNQAAQPQAQLPADYATFDSQQVVVPGANDAVQAAQATEAEEALARKLSEEKKQTSSHITDHMKVLNPLHDRDGNIIKQELVQAAPAPAPAPAAPVAPAINPAFQRLSQNDDLNISTLSREAQRINKDDGGEVTINLH